MVCSALPLAVVSHPAYLNPPACLPDCVCSIVAADGVCTHLGSVTFKMRFDAGFDELMCKVGCKAFEYGKICLFN